MKFGEKLERLTRDRNRSSLARLAGLPMNAISDYINKGHTPRADAALRIAQALSTPLAWLVDETQSWPPPPPERPHTPVTPDMLPTASEDREEAAGYAREIIQCAADRLPDDAIFRLVVAAASELARWRPCAIDGVPTAESEAAS